jgi:pyruvate ferredoxin oxidoreductase gamma subunit
VHNTITNPAIVVVLDETLLESVDVTEGLLEGGMVILNSEMSVDQARERLGLDDSITLAVVDASTIARETIGRDVPNTPIVGALARVTGLIPLDAVKQRLVIMFGKKFSREVIDANLTSVDRAYEEVKLV